MDSDEIALVASPPESTPVPILVAPSRKVTMPVGVALVAAFGWWLWLSRKEPMGRLVTGVAAWLFLADLFVPAYRNNYNDVLILNVAALGLILSAGVPYGLWACGVALLLGWGIDLLVPTQAWLINLPSLCFTVAAILFLFSFDKRLKPGKLPPRRPVRTA